MGVGVDGGWVVELPTRCGVGDGATATLCTGTGVGGGNGVAGGLALAGDKFADADGCWGGAGA
ncbi:MAG: hypothetical protein L0177_05145 [Chloroflexi bacterium]|nr:hypothetical protein [Chloroflexota bacterium]